MTEIEEIESKYDIVSPQTNGLYIWPLIRQTLVFAFATKKTGSSAKRRSRDKIQILKNSLYGLQHLIKLKKYDYLFFNNADKRISTINDKKFDVFFDTWADLLGQKKSLFIEWAIIKHYPGKFTYSKNVISDLSLKFFCSIASVFIKINSDDLICFEKIKNDYGVEFNVKKELKSKLGEIEFYRLLFRWIKPKKIFLISGFTKMSITIAAHLERIIVYEAQHGYIGENNQSYLSSFYFGEMYYPDYLLAFGYFEKRNIPKYFIFRKEQIKPIGSYYLEKVKLNFYNPILEELTHKYSTVFCVSLQTVKEVEFLNWIKVQAKRHLDWLFILKPRNNLHLNYNSYTDISNIVFYPEFDVYQILKYSNFNITIYSTTGVEAGFYDVKTILFNIDSLSTTYINIKDLYATLISPLENISEKHLVTNAIGNSQYFIGGYEDNVKNFRF